jgi:hypothetical protein
MTCDWLSKWMRFDHLGTSVTLQDFVPADTDAVSEILGEQLHKLAKDNDIWALVTALSSALDDSKQKEYMLNGIPTEIQKLIYDNADLFGSSDSLPPRGCMTMLHLYTLI